MTKAPPVLARVFRGPRVESAHRGSAAVVDERGALLASCGDAHVAVYARSAAKPFQAVPLLLAGGEKWFRLSAVAIAVLFASIAGAPRSPALAALLLRKVGFTVAALVFSDTLPMQEPSARALLPAANGPRA